MGNFVADAIRGKEINEFPEGIRLGIEIHRFIDEFTDSHELPLASRKLLYPYFGKYAAVVQDIFYDHYLALDWKLWHPEDLIDFSRKVYATLNAKKHHLNPRAQRTLYYMELHGWLENYVTPEGIDMALTGMAHRAKFESNMENSLPALKEHFKEMQDHFNGFFPMLENAVIVNFESRVSALSES